ncbi:rab15 effector protein [Microcaecilia unicolor]|uniref:Rab15 effector protein n=1 Tax=Microcaecilia unicolor TaxID=1415580 RepID=A0A6P7Z0H2_9AMPH|nr:rab15 effector protein [Microcaecilia unicolor]
MGQSSSQRPSPADPQADVIIEVFGQAAVQAAQRLQDFLGFEDPQRKLRPRTDTLSEIFLVHFITFCAEKGVEERITTSKLSKQQSLLLGVDWVWTLLGPDRLVKLQIAVQALQMGDQEPAEGYCAGGREVALADELYRSEKSRYEKLEEFCALVGRDCLGLFLVFGLPGKPRDVRGILLSSVSREKSQRRLSGEEALRQLVTGTDSFLLVKDMLENGLLHRDGGRLYVHFL